MDPVFLMNIQRIKALTWVGTVAVGVGLTWSVTDFLGKKGELSAPVPPARQFEVLNNIVEPEPPKDDRTDIKYITQGFHEMNWTGIEEEKPVEVVDVGPEETPEVQVATLLDVLMIGVDTGDATNSRTLVRYLDPDLEEAAAQGTGRILYIGDSLLAPHDYAKVSDILPGGVEFSFVDENREAELIAPVEFPSGEPDIIKVDETGAILPESESQIERVEAPPFRPAESYQLGKNEWLLGFETVEEMNTDYSKILSQDVRYRSHRDPATGQVDGIEVTKVKAGSIVAGHGVEEGEVLKSINGHKVTGVNDAIAYVKKEADYTDTWYAVFEKRGREITRVYHSPPGD